jgi:hypothetical protein
MQVNSVDLWICALLLCHLVQEKKPKSRDYTIETYHDIVYVLSVTFADFKRFILPLLTDGLIMEMEKTKTTSIEALLLFLSAEE